MSGLAEIIDALKTRFDNVVESEFRGQTRVVIPQSTAFEAIAFLKKERGFDMLVDITCVDYLNYRDATHRFGLAYLLVNTISSERLTLRVMLDDDSPTVSSGLPLMRA